MSPPFTKAFVFNKAIVKNTLFHRAASIHRVNTTIQIYRNNNFTTFIAENGYKDKISFLFSNFV